MTRLRWLSVVALLFAGAGVAQDEGESGESQGEPTSERPWAGLSAGERFRYRLDFQKDLTVQYGQEAETTGFMNLRQSVDFDVLDVGEDGAAFVRARIQGVDCSFDVNKGEYEITFRSDRSRDWEKTHDLARWGQGLDGRTMGFTWAPGNRLAGMGVSGLVEHANTASWEVKLFVGYFEHDLLMAFRDDLVPPLPETPPVADGPAWTARSSLKHHEFGVIEVETTLRCVGFEEFEGVRCMKIEGDRKVRFAKLDESLAAGSDDLGPLKRGEGKGLWWVDPESGRTRLAQGRWSLHFEFGDLAADGWLIQQEILTKWTEEPRE